MKSALVTGASSGIGRAIALGLASDGFRVVATARRLDLLEATVDHVRNGGGAAEAVSADLSDRAACDRLAARVAELAPTLHVLVHNAGVGGPTPQNDPFDVAFDRMMETNLLAPMRLTRALLPNLARDGGGRIVAVSSILARVGIAEYGAYCASKAGLVGFCRALARDLAREKITVNAALPGWTRTAMAEVSWARIGRDAGGDARAGEKLSMKDVPLGRAAEPDEVASLVRWLVSEGAAATTGQYFIVDDGAAA